MIHESFAVEDVDDTTAVVVVTGLTHGPDASRLAELLEGLIAQGHVRLVVDLTDSELLNSKLLDALVTVSGLLDPRQGEGLAVVSDTNYVRQMLEIGATGGFLLLADSRDEALEALSG